MTKKLKRQFILIATGSVLLVLGILILALNLFFRYQVNASLDYTLSMLIENDGKIPDFRDEDTYFRYNESESAAAMDAADDQTSNTNTSADDTDVTPMNTDNGSDGLLYALKKAFRTDFTPETKDETRFFLFHCNQAGNVISGSDQHTIQVNALSTKQAQAYAVAALNSKKSQGFMENYKYSIGVNKNGITSVAFVDYRTERHMMSFLLIISCAIGIITLLVVFLLVSLFSGRAIRPVVASMEKQKQFITDASHEIKTPLAVISANTDVLELSTGKSEWIDSTRHQLQRMSELIKNLLTLTKLDEGRSSGSFAYFSATEAVLDAASPFALVAKSQDKEFVLDVQPDVQMYGDATNYRQLVSILSDNAVKYASSPGRVTIALSQTGKAIRLDVSNTCDPLPEGDLSRLFDRFYRADSSRARETGGYGIGLSIAASIVEMHKGKISATTEKPNLIHFTAILPVHRSARSKES